MSAHSEPKYDRKRGRHRKRASSETRTWERDHLTPPRPPWMSADTYTKLARIRESS